jgi:hypothetical protein
MMRISPPVAASLTLLVALAWASSPAPAQQQGPKHRPPRTDAELIANAMSAAPRAVAREATIVAMDEKGQMRTLRKGTGNFTCMPDNPTTPGNDPMCLDPNGMAWAEAWMTKKEPPAGKVGFGYMLQGGSDASNEDPYATKPAPGKKWVDTGPHVMLFNVKGMVEGYPTQAGDPTKPYVMWPGTPYEHLMIPVGPAKGTPRAMSKGAAQPAPGGPGSASGAQPAASPK